MTQTAKTDRHDFMATLLFDLDGIVVGGRVWGRAGRTRNACTGCGLAFCGYAQDGWKKRESIEPAKTPRSAEPLGEIGV